MTRDPDDFRPRILILEPAWKRLLAYIEACPMEVGGLGEVVRVGNVLTVTEVFLLEQDVSTSSTVLDEAALRRLVMERDAAGHDIRNLRFWWHSHGDSQCFWSPTDRRTMAALCQDDYLLSYVGNHHRDNRVCLDIERPRMVFDDLRIEVVAEIPADVTADAQAEVAAKVRQKTWEPSLLRPFNDEWSRTWEMKP